MPAANLRPFMRAIVREMADLGYERNYRRAIVEGLDTSPEARWARAEEQGFTLPQYHATRTQPPFQSFREDGPFEMGVHTGSEPDAADNRLMGVSAKKLAKLISVDPFDYYRNGYIMPLLMRIGRQVNTPDLGRFRDPGNFLEYATLSNFSGTRRPNRETIMPKAMFDELVREAELAKKDPDFWTAWPETFRDILRRHGADAVAYKNTTELQGDTSHMGLDPANYRSVHAMFNPRRTHLRDLMAALTAALGGLGAGRMAAEPRAT